MSSTNEWTGAVRCGWCKRLLRLPTNPNNTDISDGICPKCWVGWMADAGIKVSERDYKETPR